MKIVVLTGSPHRTGTTALLADRFIDGARAAGHDVLRFDAAFANAMPCRACDVCRRSGPAPCILDDDVRALHETMVSAEGIVFVTPLYYFGMSTQLKSVVDRFYGVNARLMGGKHTALLAAGADDESWTFDALIAHYRSIARYLRWQDAGMVLAGGCAVRQDASTLGFDQQAYELGLRFGRAH